MTLTEGEKAPAFKAEDQDGNTVQLKDLKGKQVVLYFYPKDDTPGCTKEACGFRDAFSVFRRKGILVFGVSPDDAGSHQRFIRKFSLPFTLLADPGKELSKTYEVYKKRSLYGKTLMGIERTTFLIDEHGIIKRIFRRVKPEGHAEEILAHF